MASAEIGALRVSLSADTAAFEQGLGRASSATSKAAGQIESRFAAMNSKLSGITSGLAKGLAAGFLGGLAGGAVMQMLEQVPAAVRSIVAAGAGLVDTANKVGLTTTALQELHFAANQGGASLEDMDKALGVFAKNLGEASQGQGELLKILQANNVAIRDQSGQMRPASDLIRDYADLVRRAGSEQERARITTVAFGRSGADLANVFRDGADGIDQAAAAARRLGVVIDDATLQRVADLDDKWEAFATTMETTVKSAVLTSVTWIDDLVERIQKVGSAMDQFRKEQAGEALSPGASIGAAAGDPKAGARAAILSGINNHDSFRWNGAEDWLGAEKPTNLPSGGNKGSQKSDAQKEQERMQQRLELLQTSLLTERQAELDNYATRMTDLKDFLDQGLISKQQYAEMALAIEKDHATQMRELDRKTAEEAAANAQRRIDAMNIMADSVSSVLGSLFGESKAAAYAQTIIATAQAVMQTYAQLGGGPWAIAAAAAVAATGAAQLATIARTTKEGGGSKPTAATATPATPVGGDTSGGSTSTLFVQGISSNQLFSGDTVRDLAQKLLDYQSDGGKVVLG